MWLTHQHKTVYHHLFILFQNSVIRIQFYNEFVVSDCGAVERWTLKWFDSNRIPDFMRYIFQPTIFTTIMTTFQSHRILCEVELVLKWKIKKENTENCLPRTCCSDSKQMMQQPTVLLSNGFEMLILAMLSAFSLVSSSSAFCLSHLQRFNRIRIAVVGN